jgi:LAO/AO transport system kinase
VFAVQPGAGDSLQYMKAGIVEIPDVAVVTKADLGDLAERTRSDLEGALGLVAGAGGWRPPVVSVAAAEGRGLDDLFAALGRHESYLAGDARGSARRRAQARSWLEAWILAESGRRGLRRLAPELPAVTADTAVSPFRWLARAMAQESGKG